MLQLHFLLRHSSLTSLFGLFFVEKKLSHSSDGATCRVTRYDLGQMLEVNTRTTSKHTSNQGQHMTYENAIFQPAFILLPSPKSFNMRHFGGQTGHMVQTEQ